MRAEHSAFVVLAVTCACTSPAVPGPGSAASDLAATTGGTQDTVVQAADVAVPADAPPAKPCKAAVDCGVPASCQQFVCDRLAGCVAVALPDGALCTPADKCAQGGTCALGVCQPGKPNACDDANPCTADQCNPTLAGDGCAHLPTAGACDDGDPCTDGDSCDGGSCKPGPVPVCACKLSADCAKSDDGNPCNGTLYCDQASKTCKVNPASVVTCPDNGQPCAPAQCDPKTGSCGAAPAPDGTPCTDGKACTLGDACAAGTCKPGANACCTSDVDCASADDGNLCNGVWFCNKAAGACQFNPATVVQCPTANDTACVKNVCETKTGQCTAKQVSDGIACDDGNPCTSGDACQAGLCKASASTCACTTDAQCGAKDDGNLCNGVPYCNKATGNCETNPATIVVCQTAGDTVCSTTQCDPKVGKCAPVFAADGKACEADGSPCTVGDHCKTGSCVAGTDVCACKADADCKAKEDGNACNGTLYCNKASGACELNPKTVVVCPVVNDSACKKNLCDPANGQCAMVAVNEFGPCDADGLLCTLNDQCKQGECKAGANICECLGDADCAAKDDADLCNGALYCDKTKPFFACAVKPGSVVVCEQNGEPPCSISKCQPETGKCKLTLAKVGLDCDDGSLCTLGDACFGGTCGPLATLNCDDANPCTTDACKAKSGCLHLPVAATCSDGDACTQGEGCTNGKCQGGKAVVCADANPCTDDACAAATGCVHLANAATCDDGDTCTLGDGCADGQCANAGANPCSDAEPCTLDACDPKSGLCTHKPQASCVRSACLADSDCLGGQLCDPTVNSCVACLHAGHCANGQVCSGGLCVPGTACQSFVPCKPKGMVCHGGTQSCVQCLQDGDCGAGKVCQGQRCAAAPKCQTDQDCPAVCDLTKKVCADCNADGDCPGGACGPDHMCRPGHTGPKACAGGNLFAPKPGNQAYAVTLCADDNPCTDGACAALQGCSQIANSKPCDDGNPCSLGDACQGGKCLKGAKNKCDDGKPCTMDACDPDTLQCSHEPYVGPCNDGDACTVGENCTGGACKDGKPLKCDDGNACTDDSCDKVGGCVFAPNAAPCDSGSCTTGDGCQGGTCVSSKKAVVWASALAGSKAETVKSVVSAGGAVYGVIAHGAAQQPAGGALVRLDAVGQVAWQVEPDVGPAGTLAAVTVVAGGQLALLGSKCGPGGCLPWLGRFDADGKKLAELTFGSAAITLVAATTLPSGSVALAGRIKAGTKDEGMVYATNAEVKAISWQRQLPGSLSQALLAVAPGPGGDTLAAGWSSTASAATDGWVVRLDEGGNVVWQRQFGGAGTDQFNAVAMLNSGDIALAGATGSKGAGGVDGWFVRLVGIGERADDRTFGTAGDDEFLAIANVGGRIALAGRAQGKGSATQGWLLALDGWGNSFFRANGQASSVKTASRL